MISFRSVIETDMYESIDDVVEDALVHKDGYRLWVEHALDEYGIVHRSFNDWLSGIGVALTYINEDTIFEYHGFLVEEASLEALLDHMTEEIFFLMFLNRDFLRTFNEMIADRISELVLEALAEQERAFFRKDGVLRRSSIPAWARRAVFYRDRGLCSICRRDISGLVNTQSEDHFDHIVPLALGGINDVTNLQLLCQQCNLSKGGRSTDTSRTYEAWY